MNVEFLFVCVNKKSELFGRDKREKVGTLKFGEKGKGIRAWAPLMEESGR